ncbi:hypothetical protein MVEN_02271500 [Mycena venus]|uniref:Uncharacterized protein n=1 Tax=Mycena venus TaxID=2733690 RepID=A0A8H7CFV6_9AGAR|nr:hypothetical protein MVEN_02271500 [Mycena venus]
MPTRTSTSTLPFHNSSYTTASSLRTQDSYFTPPPPWPHPRRPPCFPTPIPCRATPATHPSAVSASATASFCVAAISLTTGLGWSDSEDEDAPSTASHPPNLHQSAPQFGFSRASSLSLSARASTFSSSSRTCASSSTRASTFSSSTSRSTSRTGVSRRTQSEHEHEATDTDTSANEFNPWHQPTPSAS